MLKNYLIKNKITLLGIVIGAIGGLLYWKFVGCSTGTCPITSSPVNSSIWGGLMGGLLFNIFTKNKKKDE